MKVNVTIRDEEGRRKGIKRLLIPLIVWFIVFCCSMYIMINFTIWAMLGIVTCVIAFIPMVVCLLIKANKEYNSTWITKEIEFLVVENRLYLDDKKPHVNYSKEYKEMYVHDMGNHKNKYKATFYGTIYEPDTDRFMEYLEKNGVPIESEEIYIGISRYRH